MVAYGWIGKGNYKRVMGWGSPGGSSVWRLPSALGVILGSRDGVPRRAPGMETASPSSCVSASLSLSLYVYHKINKSLLKKIPNAVTLTQSACVVLNYADTTLLLVNQLLQLSKHYTHC